MGRTADPAVRKRSATNRYDVDVPQVACQRKPAKEVLCIRLAPSGITHIADRAARADVTASHMARRMLAYAAAKMPEGWLPT